MFNFYFIVASIDGWYNEPVSAFIANGSVSEHVPYMVSIRHRIKEADGFGFGHFCGGILISRSHVLTLGSCINRTTTDGSKIIWRPDQLRLVLGSRSLYNLGESLIAIPSQIRIHPDYSWDELRNNIALIIVSKTGYVLRTSYFPLRKIDPELYITVFFL